MLEPQREAGLPGGIFQAQPGLVPRIEAKGGPPPHIRVVQLQQRGAVGGRAQGSPNVLAVRHDGKMKIRATVFHYPANEIDIGGVVLHKEYVFHCGSPPCFSLRGLTTLKRGCKKGGKKTGSGGPGPERRTRGCEGT